MRRARWPPRAVLTLDAIPTSTPLRQAAPPTRTAVQSLQRYLRLGTRLCWRRLGEMLCRLRAAWLRALARPRLRGKTRLCLGSGNAPLPDWTNVDLDGLPDVRLDLSGRLPIADASVSRIYSEHLIEHLSCEQGEALLRECRRVLARDGVLRIATPDLTALVDAYRDDWRAQAWMQWPGHAWIDTPARMLNLAMRGWGHQHVYDAHELEHRLRRAGFTDIRRCDLGRSAHHDLAGLETRDDSKLIFEARAPREDHP